MRTLAELNAKTHLREWDTLTLRSSYAVGRVGRRRSGDKTHILFTEHVIENRDQKPGHVKPGDLFSAHAPCNGNGQHIGVPVKGWDTKDITCASCLRWMEVK